MTYKQIARKLQISTYFLVSSVLTSANEISWATWTILFEQEVNVDAGVFRERISGHVPPPSTEGQIFGK